MDIEKLLSAINTLKDNDLIIDGLIHQKINEHVQSGLYKTPYSEWFYADQQMIKNITHSQVMHLFETTERLLQSIKLLEQPL